MLSTDFFTRLGVLIVEDFFDAELCTKLCSEIRSTGRKKAPVANGDAVEVVEEVRRTKSASVSETTLALVRARLETLVPVLQDHFAVVLTDYEAPKFLIYETGDYFRAHRDSSSHADNPEYLTTRKVSTVVFLNGETSVPTPRSYGGGALRFYNLMETPPTRAALIGKSGTLVAFTSDLFHEVTAVTHGERYTIVTLFH